MLTGAEIRRSFLKFFEERGHVAVPSSSLVPNNDPTLMFTNSGMVQFKDNFTGVDTSLKRAVSSQRCVRAGGKHNDLENVGHTARHHTFFEMLGNFSFGDYFKEESITWGWQFLTENMQLDPSRLCVTIYHDDDEAFDIWNKKIGLKKEDIIRIPTSDNFWTMGDTGPCGPCSEIFYDLGANVAGDRPGTPDEDGDRFMEIWNHVFTQFDLQPDGSQKLLKNKNIDTGMGLERLMAVVQGVQSNYDTDIFQTLIKAAGKEMGVAYGDEKESDVALRVVADHLRTMSFLMIDGVMPSNEGRGYVLRRIMRRAMRYTNLIGVEKPVVYKLVPTLINVMGEAYPELARGGDMVANMIQVEEERFGRTLKNGLKVLEEESSNLKKGDTLSGDVAFKLYDTFGFPMDLTADALRNRGVTVDEKGFAECMAGQRAKARAAHKGTGDEKIGEAFFDIRDEVGQTDFLGYVSTYGDADLKALVKNGKRVEKAVKGDKVKAIFNQTPFYAESGGQVGDMGEVSQEGGKAKVLDTQKIFNGILFVHELEVTEGELNVGTATALQVDEARRTRIRNNHSATHLLDAILIQQLGDHVHQKGSLVNEEKLRFDFSHPKGLSADEIANIELAVNQMIWANGQVSAEVMPKEKAIEKGAVAMFGEKYGDDVRVIDMGETGSARSVELCGGTHVPNTGVIGLFKITSESAVSAGVRRIEGVTGKAAWDDLKKAETTLREAASAISAAPHELAERVVALQKEKKKLEADVKAAKKGGGSGDKIATLFNSAETVGGVQFIGAALDDMEPDLLREVVDDLKNRLKSGVIVLASETGGKSTFVVGVTNDLTGRMKAGNIVNAAAATVGGKGGGRPDMAMAGGPAGDLVAAVAAAREVVAS